MKDDAANDDPLVDLMRVLARASAEAANKLGLEFDVNDPDVARDLIRVTFEALVLSR